ncbi:hypothetical protein J0X19_02490 [Hymenobacter sp. BT186]|uniref:Uncharacterized protein n=1 Tax=Hymenobacter telluris TaxID=2816474 RepID=A0A939J987_9BACT|nr:hypothetical protein [Hymenobacter telluris]MBO0356801.1 hypothetical protein [Hymenobacter telluris]MBW3372827.1 hypothetical protein [Hymenobacter norwichensis]
MAQVKYAVGIIKLLEPVLESGWQLEFASAFGPEQVNENILFGFGAVPVAVFGAVKLNKLNAELFF